MRRSDEARRHLHRAGDDAGWTLPAPLGDREREDAVAPVSRGARLARLQKKLADLDKVLVVHVFGKPDAIYIGRDEAVRKERERREVALRREISTRRKRRNGSRSSSRQRGA